MVLNIGERIRGFLFTPSGTFDNSRDDTLGDAFKYFVVILTIYAVLISTMFILSVSSMMPQVLTIIGGPYIGTVIAFIFILVYGIFGIFLMGIWTHIWLYFISGKKGVTQTLKALLYATTPYCLLGWIPSIYLVTTTYGGNTSGILKLFLEGIRFVGIPIAIWAFIVAIIGIRQLHELSTGKAALAVIIAMIIPVIIMAIIAAFIAMMPGEMFLWPRGPRFGGY